MSDNKNLTVIEDFLSAINRLIALKIIEEVSANNIIEAINNLLYSLNSSTEKHFALIYIESMADLANIMSEKLTAELYHWFYLGVLIFEIAIFSVIDKEAIVVKRDILTLRALIDIVELPLFIHNQIVLFCDNATREEAVLLIGQGLDIASMLYSLL